MQIDGFTFVAQIVNFLILIALLYYFLYDPIVSAIRARGEAIEDRLQSAEAREREAEEERRKLREQRDQLERTRAEHLERARREAEQTRTEMIERARRDVQQMRERWIEELKREQSRFLESFRERMAGELVEATRRALEDLADERLHDAVVRTFTRRLQRGEGPAGELIEPGGTEEMVVRSGFPLGDEQRERIRDVLRAIDGGAPVAFEQDPDLTVGIELVVGGRHVAWTIQHYVDRLESALLEALGENVAETPDRTAPSEFEERTQ